MIVEFTGTPGGSASATGQRRDVRRRAGRHGTRAHPMACRHPSPGRALHRDAPLRYSRRVDRTTVELSALAFQSLLTVILAILYYRLWETQHRAYFLSW